MPMPLIVLRYTIRTIFFAGCLMGHTHMGLASSDPCNEVPPPVGQEHSPVTVHSQK